MTSFDPSDLGISDLNAAIVAQAPVGIYVMSERGFEFLNPACEKITGLSLEYLRTCGREFLDQLHPEDRKFVLERYQARREGKPVPPTHRARLMAKNGTVKHLEFDTASLPGRKGTVIGILRDVTKEKLGEDKLRESEARFRNLVERANEGVVIVQDAIIKYVNPYMVELCGFSYDEYIGKPFYNFVATDYAEMMIELNKRRMAGDQVILNYEAALKNNRSLRVPVDININEFLSEGKRTFLVIIHDITRHKDVEEELRTALDRLRHAMNGTIQAISMILETRDPYTAGHQHRVADLARTIATKMGLSNEQKEAIRISGQIHDIGKISVPTEILTKPTTLTASEFQLIKTHPKIAYDILKNIDFPWAIADIVYQHHERLDGSGYPQGLKDDQILVEAKILAVADVTEAMVSDRPYRAARTLDEALAELIQNVGTCYDPGVVEVCIKLFKEEGFDFHEQVQL